VATNCQNGPKISHLAISDSNFHAVTLAQDANFYTITASGDAVLASDTNDVNAQMPLPQGIDIGIDSARTPNEVSSPRFRAGDILVWIKLVLPPGSVCLVTEL
jgi:hypothetical protein